MTLAELMEEIKDNLLLEGIEPPSAKRMLRAINHAKDDVTAEMQTADQGLLTARQTYTVAAGDASITLPADFRELISLVRTDQNANAPVECIVKDFRQLMQYVPNPNDPVLTTQAEDRPTLYREGDKLYFWNTAATGAPSAMTLVLRYGQRVADLDGTSQAASFTTIPDEWEDLIQLRATLRLIPGSHKAQPKWAGDYAARLTQMRRMVSRPIRNRPLRVQFDPDSPLLS